MRAPTAAAAPRRDRPRAARRRAPSTASRRRAAHALAVEDFLGVDGERDFRTGRDENEVGTPAVGVGEHVSAFAHGCVAFAEERQLSAASVRERTARPSRRRRASTLRASRASRPAE